MTTAIAAADARRDELAGRLGDATIAAFELISMYLGDRLGLYRALQEGGPATSAELSSRAGIAERYAREWLEQQAVAGILSVDDADAPPELRRFELPEGHAEVLVEEQSVAYSAPMSRFVVGAAQALPRLLDAYRSGAGIDWADYGPDVVEAQSAINRPGFEANVATSWIPALPDIDQRLRSEPTARVADIACGTGWSTIAIARGYPSVRVDGLDLDEGSIELANATRATLDAGLADRVTFAARDAADPKLAGQYTLVTIFEAVHDMSQPVTVLRAARRLLAPGGAVLVADERVAERFEAPGDAIDRLMYGFSITTCLPNGLAEQPSVATGAVMRPATLERYAREAGFASVSVLPIEHDTFRFYRLDP